MIHRLSQGQEVAIILFAKDFYSRDSLAVEPGESYQILCNKQQCWWDWFIPSSPLGYKNILAAWAGLRLKSSKCFCLCGVYDKDETRAFEIGISYHISPLQHNTILYFFANDSRKAYWNNWGKIKIVIKRI